MKWSILALLLLLGCSSSSVTHFQGVAHTHSYHIQIGGHLPTKAKQDIKSLIDNVFDEVDTYYNHWNPLSELSKVNRGEIACSPKLNAILTLAMTFKELTNDRYDPMLGAVTTAWKKSLKEGELPSLDHLKAEVDLDGMLKGYALDLLVEKLNNAGYKNVYVEWGGDICVSGNHPEKRPWRILVEGEVIELEGALATSGNEQQQWTVQDKTYTHIVDPHTLSALEVKRPMNVTVKAPKAALADALATACMTLTDTEKALEWAEAIKMKQEGVEFWIVTKP